MTTTCNERFGRNDNQQDRLRGQQTLSTLILTARSDCLRDKILFFRRGGRKEETGDIREHILTYETHEGWL